MPCASSNELLERNLGFLKKHSSSVSFQNTVSAKPGKASLEVKTSEGCPPVFYCRTEQSQALLHSSRAPEKEAQRQVSAWEEENKNVNWENLVTVLGFGGMYHITELLRRIKPGGTLLVIDRMPDLFKASLSFCDLEILEKIGANIIFIVSESFETIKREFRHYLKRKTRLDISLFIHPGIYRTFTEDYNELIAIVKTEVRTEAIDRGTKIHLADEWMQHSIYNLPFILRSPLINELKNSFSKNTALIAAAGPSLNSSLPWIKKICGKCVIIAVGTALKPLLEAEIYPDFVLSLECDILAMKQFKGMEKGKIFLLAPPIVFPELLDIYSGQFFTFSISVPDAFDKWLKELNAAPDTLNAGGTVSLTAIDSAVYMGFSKIILTGLDLSFLDDGTTHASKSMYHGQRSDKETLISVDGNYNRKVLTSTQFSTYISMLGSYLEDVLKNRDIVFYNATDGGAVISNTRVISPLEMLSLDFSALPGNKTEYIKGKYDKALMPDEKKVIEFIDLTIKQLDEFKQTAEAAETACSIMFSSEENTKHSGRLNDELKKLDLKIKEENSASPLLNSTLRTLVADLRSDETVSAQDKNRRFYSHLKGAAEWLKGILEISLKCYKNKTQFKINTGRI